jgi:hypothetical protein
LAQEMNKLLDWDNNAQCCYQCIIALSVTERLPAQQVLEQFSSPAAGECNACHNSDSSLTCGQVVHGHMLLALATPHTHLHCCILSCHTSCQPPCC